MEYVSFSVDEKTKDKIIDFYRDHQQENSGEYIEFFARYENNTVTVYRSKKGYKAVFNGPDCLKEVRIFHPDAALSVSKKKEKTEFLDLGLHGGSDEVGFGDFFGPLVVVGAIYDPSLSDFISSIRDSKKLTDDFILRFVPTILDKVVFSKLTVRNAKYNEMISRGINMNRMKAMLHNRVLLNLKAKRPDCRHFYIDQFCAVGTYYSYLSEEKEKLLDVSFHTKGESYYPAVALASMIARYCFLKEMDALSEKYGMTFPKGASASADRFALEFIRRYSKEELTQVCKTNFVNYKNIK